MVKFFYVTANSVSIEGFPMPGVFFSKFSLKMPYRVFDYTRNEMELTRVCRPYANDIPKCFSQHCIP